MCVIIVAAYHLWFLHCYCLQKDLQQRCFVGMFKAYFSLYKGNVNGNVKLIYKVREVMYLCVCMCVAVSGGVSFCDH